MESGDKDKIVEKFGLLSCPNLLTLVYKEDFDALPRSVKFKADSPDRDLIKRLKLCIDSVNKTIFAFSSNEFLSQQFHRLRASNEEFKEKMMTLEIPTMLLIEEVRDLQEATLHVDFGFEHSMKVNEDLAVELLDLQALAQLTQLDTIFILKHKKGGPVIVPVEGWNMLVAYLDMHHAEKMIEQLARDGGHCELDWCIPARFVKTVLETKCEGVVFRPGTSSQTTFSKDEIESLKLVTGEPSKLDEFSSKVSQFIRRFS